MTSEFQKKFCICLNNIVKSHCISQNHIRSLLNKNDLSKSIPSLTDGQIYTRRFGNGIIIGKTGMQALRKATDVFFDLHKSISDRVTYKEINEVIGCVIARWIQRRKQYIRESEAINISKIIDRYLRKHILKNHYLFLPCVLTKSSKDEFRIGKVTFISTKKFLLDYSCNLHRTKLYLENMGVHQERKIILSGRSNYNFLVERKWPRNFIKTNSAKFVDDFIEIAHHYPWMASIEIQSCSQAMALNKGRQAIELALNIIRLRFGAEYADIIRQSGRDRIETRTAYAILNLEGNFNISLSRRFEGNALPDDWPNIIENDITSHLISGLITSISGGHSLPPLYQRIVDALSWYGEAVMDAEPHNRIIKSLMGLERILVTGKGNSLNMVKTRGPILCSLWEKSKREYWRNTIKNLYVIRHDIIHGRCSPFDKKVIRAAPLADSVVSQVLEGAVCWYRFVIGDDPHTSEGKLNAMFEQKLENFWDTEEWMRM